MTWSIGDVEREIGLSADTLRYYERIALLPPPRRTAGGRRLYGNVDLKRLRFIRRAQAVGFSLSEIRGLLRFREDPANCSPAVRELAVRKHEQVHGQLELLHEMDDQLGSLLAICSGRAGSECAILEQLDGRARGSLDEIQPH